jgi:hypothetical protein
MAKGALLLKRSLRFSLTSKSYGATYHGYDKFFVKRVCECLVSPWFFIVCLNGEKCHKTFYGRNVQVCVIS